MSHIKASVAFLFRAVSFKSNSWQLADVSKTQEREKVFMFPKQSITKICFLLLGAHNSTHRSFHVHSICSIRESKNTLGIKETLYLDSCEWNALQALLQLANKNVRKLASICALTIKWICDRSGLIKSLQPSQDHKVYGSDLNFKSVREYCITSSATSFINWGAACTDSTASWSEFFRRESQHSPRTIPFNCFPRLSCVDDQDKSTLNGNALTRRLN